MKRTASVSDAMSWLRIEADLLRETIVNEITDKNHYDKRRHQEAQADWIEISRGLTCPGGLFGPNGTDMFVRWMLDTSEGPARTRRRLVKNFDFYGKYPASYFNELGGKHRSPCSAFSDELYRANNPEVTNSTEVNLDLEQASESGSDEGISLEENDIESIARKLGGVSFPSQDRQNGSMDQPEEESQ